MRVPSPPNVIKEVKTIRANNDQAFDRKVNEMLDDGWKLNGYPVYLRDSSGCVQTYIQPMVKMGRP